MTPVGHSATGAAAGGIISPLLNKVFRIPHRAVIALAMLGSIIPDIDAASLLFDHNVYYGKLWYSHHIFFHSLLGALAISVFMSMVYLTFAIAFRGTVNIFRRDKRPLESRLLRFAGAVIASYIGCLVHFLGDCPTPPGPWGGIALLWPSMKMYGGWNRIFWHNWYLIYLSAMFIIIFIPAQVFAGLLSLIKIRYVRWGYYGFRALIAVFSVLFFAKIYFFIKTNDLNKLGYNEWDRLNRSMVPAEYMKNADAYYEKATVFWRKISINRDDVIKFWNRVVHEAEEFHRKAAPVIDSFVPSFRSPSEELVMYREFQKMAPGMEDGKPGKYRVWILRDMHPDPNFYDKAFLQILVHRLNENVLQITNAWMVIFRIDERDGKGNATKVSRIYHSNKIYVPDLMGHQLNQEKMKLTGYRMWKHDKVPYNLLPRSAYSRYQNLVKGYYPSLNLEPGYIWPGYRTGIMLHAGVWSEGCIIACYGHMNFGNQFQYPFYSLWELADELIDIRKEGGVHRGKERIWGSMIILRDPAGTKLAEVDKNMAEK